MFIYDRRSDNPDMHLNKWMYDFDFRISGVGYQSLATMRCRNTYQALKWFRKVKPEVERFFSSRKRPLEFWDYDDQDFFFYIKDYNDVIALKLLLT